MTQDKVDRQLIERLRRDHDKMRVITDELVGILRREAPSQVERMARLRWDLASLIMSHLAFEDREFYSKLANDQRPHVQALAQRFREELRDKFESYSEHIEQWSAPRIADNWDGYRKSSLEFLGWLMNRADREESQLFPLVLTIGSESTRSAVVSWARDAFRIKDAIVGSGVGR